MRARYGRCVVPLRERGCGAARLIGIPYACGNESAYRSRTGEPMMLLQMLISEFTLLESRLPGRDAYPSGRRVGQACRHIRQRNVRRWSLLPVNSVKAASDLLFTGQ
jgi:hypothetical protein